METVEAVGTVRAQARSVADGYRFPAGRRLCAILDTLAGDTRLLEIAATAPVDRLPALLFLAAAQFLILKDRPQPIHAYFLPGGVDDGSVDDRFAAALPDFCLERRAEMVELIGRRRYQMSEIGRASHLLPALALAARDHPERALALIDVGSGAGTHLHLDRYHHRYGDGRTWGDAASPVAIDCAVRGPLRPPLPEHGLRIAERIGIDLDPPDLDGPDGDDTLLWLQACLPFGFAALARAIELGREDPVRVLAGDAVDRLAEAVATVPADRLVCVLDSYALVFFPDAARARFLERVREIGARRDVAWISLDPLVPLGDGRLSVQDLAVPPELVERTRSEGGFGVLGMREFRAGATRAAILAIGHPAGLWIEWLQGDRGVGWS